MKMTVCEFPDEARRKDAAWTDLVHYLQMSPADVVVLPEMPFCDWKMFLTRTVDPAVWREALAIHDAMVARFAELQAAIGQGGGHLIAAPRVTSGHRRWPLAACMAAKAGLIAAVALAVPHRRPRRGQRPGGESPA